MKRFALLAAGAVTAGLLGLYSASPEPARAQNANKELANKARDIFQKNCTKCHGSTATASVDVREYKNLIVKRDDDSKLIEPKKLDDSLIWQRVGVNKDMPPKPGPLAAAEIKTLETWIKAGAPEWDAVGAAKEKKRPFVSTREVLEAILYDLREAEPEDKSYLRYFTINHLNNNPAITEQQMRLYRAALSKVLNSMHWRKPIIIPRQVDKYGTVYAIDLRDFDWDRKRMSNGKMEPQDRWAVMMNYYLYGLAYKDGVDEKVEKLQIQLDKETTFGKIMMRGDWFVARATRPPIYEKVLRLPDNAYDLEQKLGVNVLDNFRRNRLARAGYKKSFVSAQNRLVERHDSLFGAYWKSYDFKPGAKKGNLLTRPLGPASFQASFSKYPYTDVAFVQDGGEMVFNLPNGMQGYFLVNGKDKFIPKGPTDVVQDEKHKASGTAEIINGLSCMVCHKDGMIDSVKDDVRAGTSLDRSEFMRKIRQIYIPQKAMLDLVAKDRRTFHASLKEAMFPFLSEADQKKEPKFWAEPIFELVSNYYHEGLTLERVGYELGYSEKTIGELRGMIKGNKELQALGLRALLKEGGTVPRDEWDFGDKFEKIDEAGESTYQRAAKELDLGRPRR